MANISDIPIRSNGQTVDASWWNIIRTILIDVFASIIPNEFQVTIANNAGATAISGLIFSSGTTHAVRLITTIYRQTDAPTQIRSFTKLFATFKPTAGWAIDYQHIGDDPGVTFTINTTTGQISYASTNIAGANYVGKMRYKTTDTFSVET